MPTRIVKFKEAGGPITMEAICGYAQGGSYTYHLWEKDEKTQVKSEKGKFSDNPPQRHTLDGLNKDNDQRFVEFDSSIAIIPPEKRYLVTVNVYQDGNKIDSVTDPETGPGTATSSFEDSDIYFQLIKY